MTLTDFIKQLQQLQVQGYGYCPVYYRNGASGDCGELSSAHVSTLVDENGPFDLWDMKHYISISAGN